MTANSSDIILHNYPQSPVSEKIRVMLGMKGLAWHDLDIPRLPPKPLLTPLTGGYRRTPVMQIGADIFCDSQCIIRELERRYPSVNANLSINPNLSTSAGLMWCLSRWTDGELFDLALKIVLGAAGDDLPEDFAKDRGLLYFGEDWAERLKEANAELSHLVAQLRAPLSWINNNISATLSDDQPFILGSEPSAIDAQIYYVIWFIRGRWNGGTSFLSEFSYLEQWEKSIRAIGHGTSSVLTGEEALAVALDSESITEKQVTENDPQGLLIGAKVSITPDMESGEESVEGLVRSATVDTISIDHSNDKVGKVCVHFPRTGYRIAHN